MRIHIEDKIAQLECEYQDLIDRIEVACNTLDLIEEIQSGAASVQKWIPVTESIPQCRALAYTPDVDIELRYRIIPAGLFRNAASSATHWMKLPDEPK